MSQPAPVHPSSRVHTVAVPAAADGPRHDPRRGFRWDRRAGCAGVCVRSQRDGRAYNRTEFVAQRRRMMQAWADYVEDIEGCAQGSIPQ